MLTNRNLTVNFATISIRGRSAGGCPQWGSLLSAMVSCGRLLVKLRKAGFLNSGYADVVATVAREKFLSILKKRMNNVLRIIQN